MSIDIIFEDDIFSPLNTVKQTYDSRAYFVLELDFVKLSEIR